MVEAKCVRQHLGRAEDSAVREPEAPEVHLQRLLDFSPLQGRPENTQFLTVAPKRTQAQVPGKLEAGLGICRVKYRKRQTGGVVLQITLGIESDVHGMVYGNHTIALMERKVLGGSNGDFEVAFLHAGKQLFWQHALGDLPVP